MKFAMELGGKIFNKYTIIYYNQFRIFSRSGIVYLKVYIQMISLLYVSFIHLLYLVKFFSVHQTFTVILIMLRYQQ